MFKDKVAVVTGAGSALVALWRFSSPRPALAVAVSDINRAGLDETLGMLTNGKAGSDSAPRAKAYTFDVSSPEAVFAHADEVKRDFGTAHYVVNNAGVTVIGTVAHTSIDEFEWQIGINMWGVLYGTKAFLPMMLAQREGCIVNISVFLDCWGTPRRRLQHVQFAVRGLTECLWSELDGTGVRAVCVIRAAIKPTSKELVASSPTTDIRQPRTANLDML